MSNKNNVDYENEIAMYPDIMNSIKFYMNLFEYECKIFETWHEFKPELRERFQKEIDITPEMNVVELMNIISLESPLLLDKTLKGLYKGNLKPIKQDSSKATFTKKIKKEEKIIDWSMDAQKLHDKIRAMYQINTNHTTFNNKIIKILQTQVVPYQSNNIGTIVKIEKDGIVVECKNNALKIITLKPEGKGEMNATDWVRGARVKIGDCFK